MNGTVQGIYIKVHCCGYVISIIKPCESVHEKADRKAAEDAAQGPDDDDNGHVADGGAHQILQAALWNHHNYFYGSGSGSYF